VVINTKGDLCILQFFTILHGLLQSFKWCLYLLEWRPLLAPPWDRWTCDLIKGHHWLVWFLLTVYTEVHEHVLINYFQVCSTTHRWQKRWLLSPSLCTTFHKS